MVYQGRRPTQSVLDQLEEGELPRHRGPKLCLRNVGSALLAGYRGVIEEQCFEFLEGRCKLGVEVYVASQVPGEA